MAQQYGREGFRRSRNGPMQLDIVQFIESNNKAANYKMIGLELLQDEWDCYLRTSRFPFIADDVSGQKV